MIGEIGWDRIADSKCLRFVKAANRVGMKHFRPESLERRLVQHEQFLDRK